MICLEKAELVGRGGGRQVFIHPHKKQCLIKVYHSTPRRKVFTDWANNEKRVYGRFREWHVEHAEYVSLLNRSGKIPDFIPQFYGYCETSLGLGQVVEAIYDADTKKVSNTITKCIFSHDKTEIIKHIVSFFDKVEVTRTVFRDLNLSNFLVQKNKASEINRIVCVDGLGDFTFIQSRKYSKLAHKFWIEKAKQETISQILKL